MKIRSVFVIILFSLLSVIGGRAQTDRPNIVLIYADDVGWTGLGCFGSRYYETPNLDKLAEGGMRFTRGYAAACVCAPARASLMSGQYSSRHGTYRVSNNQKKKDAKIWLYKAIQPENLPFSEKIVTMAEALKAGGYVTGMFGKWHIKPGMPGVHGFDSWIVSSGRHFHFRTSPEYQVSDSVYLTDFMADHAIDFIQRNRDTTFFLYLPDFLVHKPHEAKQWLIKKYEGKKPVSGHHDPVYAAMTESLDHTVGRIYHTLDSLGLLGNTLIVFTSDNGAMARTQNGKLTPKSYTSNLPLRDGKGLMYEGGIRVPYIFYWKGKIPPGTVNKNPITALDLYPTFLDVAGIPKPAHQTLDGTSIKKCLFDPAVRLPERPLYWHYPNYGPARVKNGKIWYAYVPTDVLILGDYKLLEFYHNTVDHVELYNLKEDVGELHDLSKKMPQKVQELQTLLHKIREESGGRMPIPNPEYDPLRLKTLMKK